MEIFIGNIPYDTTADELEGLLARHRLRHKTVKQPFRTVFAITILANCAGFAWLFTADGASAQQNLDSFIAAFASKLD